MGANEYNSAKRLATEAKVLAYKKAQQPLPADPPKPGGRPLLPLSVTIDRDHLPPMREVRTQGAATPGAGSATAF
jgi:hypothetical protein